LGYAEFESGDEEGWKLQPFFVKDDSGESEEWLSLNEIITAYAPAEYVSSFVEERQLNDVETEFYHSTRALYNNITNQLDGYVTNDNLNGQLVNDTTTAEIDAQLYGFVANDELENYTTTTDINTQAIDYVTNDELGNYTTSTDINDLLDTKGNAIDNSDGRVQNIELGFRKAFDDPI